MSQPSLGEQAWTAPEVCTLPAPDQPRRVAGFDQLFALASGHERPDPRRARWRLPARSGVAARAARLMVRETRCCSFFTFTLAADAGGLLLTATVPPAHLAVLDLLVARAERSRGVSR